MGKMGRIKRTLFILFPILIILLIALNSKAIIKRTGIPGIIILIIVVLLIRIIPFVKAMIGHPFFYDGKEAKQINENGLPATAIIQSISENSKGGSMTINKQPILNLTFKISLSKESSYEVSFDSIVPRTMLSSIYPGATFLIKVDPKKRDRFVIDQSKDK